jgi:hypothetical protein
MEDDVQNYTLSGRRARICDPVLLRGCQSSLRDERVAERPRPRLDTSSLSSTLCTAFNKMPVVTIFPGVAGWTKLVSSGSGEFAASQVETLDDASHLYSDASASLSYRP